MVVEHVAQSVNLLWVGQDLRMEHFAKEVHEHFVRPGTEDETLVCEDPVIVPILVGSAMLDDVSLRRPEAASR